LAKNYDIIIIGGGLAGLSNAIHLSRAGLKVGLIEKNEFPKHKVCGEYISSEVTPYLNWLGIDPYEHGATRISRFELSTSFGKKIGTSLPLGGFGISRFTLDQALMLKAKASGCEIIRDIVDQVEFKNDKFSLQTKSSNSYHANFVIGAFGKRSKLDNVLNREFFKAKAPFLGVKAHYKGDFPNDLVALHNFEGGYCGVSKIENDLINICYLVKYDVFKKHKNIEVFQKEVIEQNPHLKKVFANSQIVFENPLTISQISFLPKKTVEHHMLMSGDAAGMIHPLCGNGMGMAIHSALILSELLLKFFNKEIKTRASLENQYKKEWNRTFRKRLYAGRIFNKLFSSHTIFEKGVHLLTKIPSTLPSLIKQTHGNVVNIPTLKTIFS